MKFFNRKGEPISLEEGVRLLKDIGLRQVSSDEVGDAYVSTVHLVLLHPCYCLEPCPGALFETMVFGGELDGDLARYHTIQEALAGHKAMVQRLREGA